MTDTPAPIIEARVDPLAVVYFQAMVPGAETDYSIGFNRAPTAAEIEAIRKAPSQELLLADLSRLAERCILDELCIRLFRVLILGNVVIPETPDAMTWLKDWIEGVNHGPVGRPMVWPSRLPGICSLLTSWGFEPTPGIPPYVTRSPKPKHEPEVTR